MKPGPRWMHKLYASAAGYFWLPCPVCGRMFGGHEIETFGRSIPTDKPHVSKVTCGHPKCPEHDKA